MDYGFDGLSHFAVDDMQISEDLQLVVGPMLMQWLYVNRPAAQ
jgi:D-sedoheptulose 7-phosphate isomerase